MLTDTQKKIIMAVVVGLVLFGGYGIYKKRQAGGSGWTHSDKWSFVTGKTKDTLLGMNYTRAKCQKAAATTDGVNAYAWADPSSTGHGDCRLMYGTGLQEADRHMPWKAGFNNTMKMDMADGKHI